MSLLESDEVARRRPSPLSDAGWALARTPTAERKPLTGLTFLRRNIGTHTSSVSSRVHTRAQAHTQFNLGQPCRGALPSITPPMEKNVWWIRRGYGSRTLKVWGRITAQTKPAAVFS